MALAPGENADRTCRKRPLSKNSRRSRAHAPAPRTVPPSSTTPSPGRASGTGSGRTRCASSSQITQPSSPAAAAIRHELGTAAAGLFGDRVHVVTDNAEATERRVTEILARAGVELQGVRPVEPSLEDVFVSVLSAGPEGGEHGR